MLSGRPAIGCSLSPTLQERDVTGQAHLSRDAPHILRTFVPALRAHRPQLVSTSVIHLREREASKFGAPPIETSGEAHAEAAVHKLTEARVKATSEVRDSVFGFAAREIVAEAKS